MENNEYNYPDESNLEVELEQARQTIHTDTYPISIGELVNMYRDGELLINPAFQRLFRWDTDQKSKLIESILIGIPLPSIFVAQNEQGVWEVIDGLQRISTILQLQGLLDDPEHPPLQLEKTKYLPSLKGVMWNNPGGKSLSPAQRLDIKRAKIDVKIIKRESDPEAKYELFQRLNSFGSQLSSQEIRNALLTGIESDFVTWIHELAAYPNFQDIVQLPETQAQSAYGDELVLRFFLLYQKTDEEIASLRHFQDQLDNFAVDSAFAYNRKELPVDKLQQDFFETFDLLRETDVNILRKWSPDRGFHGGFLNTSFEAIATTIGHFLSTEVEIVDDILEGVKEFWQQKELGPRSVTGKSTENRIRKVVPIGRKILGASDASDN